MCVCVCVCVCVHVFLYLCEKCLWSLLPVSLVLNISWLPKTLKMSIESIFDQFSWPSYVTSKLMSIWVNLIVSIFLVAPAAEKSNLSSGYGVCLLAFFNVDREIKFQLLTAGGSQDWSHFKILPLDGSLCLIDTTESLRHHIYMLNDPSYMLNDTINAKKQTFEC